MATLEQVKSYLNENETHCWRLFARRDYAKDMIGEYMAPQPDPKESLDRLEKQARMYEEMYPGTEFLVEPRRSATSNKSGVFSSLSFRLSDAPEKRGIAGGMVESGKYITLDELARREELMRRENEIEMKKILFEQEKQRELDRLRQKAKGLGQLRNRYNSKTEAFQNALEMALMGTLSGLGLIEKEEEAPEQTPQAQPQESNPKLARLNELATLVNGLTRTPEEVEMVTEIIRKTVEKQRNAHAEP